MGTGRPHAVIDDTEVFRVVAAMNSAQSIDLGSAKAKKAAAGRLPANQGRSSGPTTFFLKTEKELEHHNVQRGRRKSRSAVVGAEEQQAFPDMMESSFGVQSLDEAMEEGTLSRTNSNSSTQSSDSHGELSPARGKKRKSGNRVHPTILATGQRLISHDRNASVVSPTISDSPSKNLLFRRNSGTSANMSAPLTPIKMSPHREAVSPSTPRSGSPKSFRLSDEEISVTDDTGSQAICSSSGEDDTSNDVERTPQLVMPSLSMPVRRPFTEQGRRIGRTKIMVVGPKRVGKTSFINSMFRSCEHIVHMDQIMPSIPSQSSFATESSHYIPTTMFNEIGASTRPYPSWWTDVDSRHLRHRRLSVGEGVLERNLTFIDTPGLESDEQIQQVLNHLKLTLRRTAHMESMSDSELVSMLSGDGGVQLDAVIYLFEPLNPHGEDGSAPLSAAHEELLQYLGKWANLIPVVAQADTMSADELADRKLQVAQTLERLNIPQFELTEALMGESAPRLPLGISSATGDDAEEVDASVLMSSQYLVPLLPSDLGWLVQNLLEPANISRMRHTSATKFLLWRQQNVPEHIDLHKQTLLQSPQLSYHSRVTSAASLVDDPSKVLVPHSSSSYYRSASPAISDFSGQFGAGTGASTQALARYNEQTQAQQPTEPFRQVRLAKWASDLQRSLNNERRKYEQLYMGTAAGPPATDSEKNEQALVSTKEAYRSARGRLGGDISVFDPRDPLGILALGQTFRQRGYVVLQVVGSAGLLGAAAYWILRNWMEVQDFLGLGQPSGMVTTTAIPPPATRTGHWLDEEYLKGFFGWGR